MHDWAVFMTNKIFESNHANVYVSDKLYINCSMKVSSEKPSKWLMEHNYGERVIVRYHLFLVQGKGAGGITKLYPC